MVSTIFTAKLMVYLLYNITAFSENKYKDFLYFLIKQVFKIKGIFSTEINDKIHIFSYIRVFEVTL
jgi:hypothetical protein